MNRHHKTVLVCPLDWGMGHATRCIPIIEQLRKEGITVIAGVTAATKPVLVNHFPDLSCIVMPAYKVRYTKYLPLSVGLFLRTPAFVYTLIQEQYWLRKVIAEHHIDAVISDNRYGLFSKKIRSVFITHQVFIPAPLFTKWVNRLNHFFIRQFNYCWIPDVYGTGNLSGSLAQGISRLSQFRYIGIQSHLNSTDIQEQKSLYKFCVLLSGPEPHRSMLEQELIDICKQSREKIVFIRGSNAPRTEMIKAAPTNIFFYDMLAATQLQKILLSSAYVVCRSGYSSIMDLCVLRKKAVFIPTPGQAEQEYLATYLAAQFGNIVLTQGKIKAEQLFDEEKLSNISAITQKPENYLREAIQELMEK